MFIVCLLYVYCMFYILQDEDDLEIGNIVSPTVLSSLVDLIFVFSKLFLLSKTKGKVSINLLFSLTTVS